MNHAHVLAKLSDAQQGGFWQMFAIAMVVVGVLVAVDLYRRHRRR